MRSQLDFDSHTFFSSKMQVQRVTNVNDVDLNKVYESKFVVYERKYIMGTLKKKGM